MDELSNLLQTLPGYSLISVSMKQAALEGARVPDSFGRWPGEEGYEPTYDVYFAAVTLLGFLQTQLVIRQISSEGTSVAVDAPLWGALTAYLRSMSPIHGAARKDVLRAAPIPDRPHVHRSHMYDRGSSCDNVDTDVGCVSALRKVGQ